MKTIESMSLFSAEDLRIDPAAVFEREHQEMRPLRKVWALVLTVAVVDYLVAKPTSKRFRDAKEWIFYGDVAAANSFNNVARFLDFDPDRLRVAITCRRSEVWSDAQKAISVLAELRALDVEVAA